MHIYGFTLKRLLCAFMFLAIAGATLPVSAARIMPRADNVILFIDHSSSMRFAYKGIRQVDLGGQSKIVLAQSAARETNNLIPDLGYKTGVYTFAPFRRYAAVAPYNRATMGAAIDSIDIHYETYGRLTPMGEGLNGLDPVIGNLSGRTAVIIYSDGNSNLGRDPVAEAQRLQSKYGDRLCFMVVSFADDAKGEDTLRKISNLSSCRCFVKGEDFLRSTPARLAFLACGIWQEEAAMAEVVVFRSIYFDFDKYNIKKEFIPVLNEGVAIAKSKPGAQVVLEGHTDSVGTDRYNMGLSNRRANSVKSYFVRQGVESSRITAVGFGESQPRADNATAEGRKLNRRVEIKFKPMP